MNLVNFISGQVFTKEKKTFTRVIVNLAVATIALSVAIIVITSSLVNGFKNQISNKIFGFWGHIHITDINSSRNFEEVPFLLESSFYESIKEIEYIEYQKPASFLGIEQQGKMSSSRTVGGVSHLQSYVTAPAIIKTKTDLEGLKVKGVGVDFNWDKLKDFIIEGEYLNTLSEIAEDGILISKVTANRLSLSVGDKLVVHFITDGDQIKRRFNVKGIYNTGLAEYDRRIAIVDIRKVQQVLKLEANQINGLEVYLEDIDDMQVISEYVYYDVLPSNLNAQTIKEKLPNIFDWLGLQDINQYVILALMIAVCIINMITVILILMLDKTKFIAIMKSLGSSNWLIRKIFLRQALSITVKGIIIGLLVGLAFCYLQLYTKFIKLDEVNYYLSEAPIDIPYFQLMIYVILIAIFVIVSLVLPTYILAKMNPVKVLRFD